MATISTYRAEKIARNIDAMETNYQRIDNSRDWKFWSRLDGKIRKILSTLPPEDKEVIAEKCDKEQAKFFGIITKK